MARIVHKTGATTIHHDGKNYKPEKGGVFDVPDHVAAAMRPHGFLTEEEAEAQKKVDADAKLKSEQA